MWQHLVSLPAEAAAEAVLDVLRAEIVTILKIPAARIDPDEPVSGLGIDSLTFVEWRSALEARLGIEVPLPVLSGGGTIRAIAARIARMAGGPGKSDDMMTRYLQHEGDGQSRPDAAAQ